MKRVKKTKKSHTLIVTVGLAAGALAYVFFVFLPMQKAIADTREALREKQQFILDNQRAVLQIADTEQGIETAQQFAAEWTSHAPDDDTARVLVGRIMESAKRSQVTIQRFEPGDVQRLNHLWHKDFTVGIQGDFQQVFEFLRQVEEMPQTVWLTHLNLRRRENSEMLIGELNLMVFADIRENSD